jgi:hypothetical protein
MRIDTIIATLAAPQHGVFSTDQAVAAGIDPASLSRRTASGFIVPVHRCVHRCAAAPSTWHQQLWAATLAVDATVKAVAGQSAAAIHGYDGFRRRPVVIGTRRRCKVALDGAQIIYIPALTADDVVDVEGLAVTSPTQTLLDLSRRVSLRRLTIALDSGVRDGTVTEAALAAQLEIWRRSGRTGVRRIEQILGMTGAHGTRPHSPLEREFLDLMAAHGIPLPTCQQRVDDADGHARRMDFGWDPIPLTVEVEGDRGHADRISRSDDHDRRMALEDQGRRVLAFTSLRLRNQPAYVVRRVRNALRGLAERQAA